jgi:hypothetical protein
MRLLGCLTSTDKTNVDSFTITTYTHNEGYSYRGAEKIMLLISLYLNFICE